MAGQPGNSGSSRIGETMEADQDTIIKAVKAICGALEENDIPDLEGLIALKSVLKSKEKQAGYEIGIDERAN